MATCEYCRSTFHLKCAGVTAEALKGKSWYCGEKECKEAHRASELLDPAAVLTVEEKLKAMDEEKKRMEKEIEDQRMLREKEIELKSAMREKRMLMEQELDELEENKEKELRLKEIAAKERSLNQKLKEKTDHLNRLQQMEQTFKQQMLSVERTIGGATANSDVSGSTETRTVDENSNLVPNGLGQRRSGPTKAQLAARSGISKNLPKFSGKAEEWPVFYAMYQASTEACGFDDITNLVRLQKCLTGRARDLVGGQLILPKSVPKVINKLRQMFGRPEQLLHSHLEKVRSLEPPSSKLASFIPFGNAVEQLCEHLEAAELTDHLINPLLITELVSKLPDRDKRAWVRYKRHKESVTLRTLTDFLAEIVEDACEANVDVDYALECGKSGKEKKKKHSGSDESASSDSSSESESEAETEQTHDRKCLVCRRTDHRLRFCQDFKSMSFNERNKVVKRGKLCIICLNKHNGECTFRIHCNVGECRESHNPLLHPVDGAVGTSAHIRTENTVLFRMAPVKLHCGKKSETVLAFFDEGSSVTLVQKDLADRLGADGVKEKLTLKWTTGADRVEADSKRMDLWVSAEDADEKLLLKAVRTVEELVLPQQSLDAKILSDRYTYLRGLPINSYHGRPQLLIGLNNASSFAPMESRAGAHEEPIAIRSRLGWTVHGVVSSTSVSGDQPKRKRQQVILAGSSRNDQHIDSTRYEEPSYDDGQAQREGGIGRRRSKSSYPDRTVDVTGWGVARAGLPTERNPATPRAAVCHPRASVDHHKTGAASDPCDQHGPRQKRTQQNKNNEKPKQLDQKIVR